MLYIYKQDWEHRYKERDRVWEWQGGRERWWKERAYMWKRRICGVYFKCSTRVHAMVFKSSLILRPPRTIPVRRALLKLNVTSRISAAQRYMREWFCVHGCVCMCVLRVRRPFATLIESHRYRRWKDVYLFVDTTRCVWNVWIQYTFGWRLGRRKFLVMISETISMYLLTP